jgi:signal peptidase I
MSVMGLLYLTLYYLSGAVYGLYHAVVRLSISSFFEYIVPITVIIIASEIVRSILLAQESRFSSVLAYLICFFAELLISANIENIRTFNQFADILGYVVFPAVTSNVLYHYLARRYGKYPNISYRLITTLFPYIIPYTSQLSPALYSFARLVIPLIIYWFIDSLYERKRRYALGKKSRLSIAVSAAVLLLMLSFMMLISCQFKYGMIVIATESMTGELNKGDAIIYVAYDDQTIEEGQVVVFSRNKNKVVHRVVDVQNINGVTRYYTKGDANQDNDAGYITDAEIVGLTDFKISYIGMPTLWVRDIFS